jgi:uncharacterized protein (TIGR02118 family)
MYRIQATYAPPGPGEPLYFDKDYYLNHHMPLSNKGLKDHVQILRADVAFDVRTVRGNQDLRWPCVYTLYVQELGDVEAFRAFLESPHVAPLRADVSNFTNLRVEWTFAEVFEG